MVHCKAGRTDNSICSVSRPPSLAKLTKEQKWQNWPHSAHEKPNTHRDCLSQMPVAIQSQRYYVTRDHAPAHLIQQHLDGPFRALLRGLQRIGKSKIDVGLTNARDDDAFESISKADAYEKHKQGNNMPKAARLKMLQLGQHGCTPQATIPPPCLAHAQPKSKENDGWTGVPWYQETDQQTCN